MIYLVAGTMQQANDWLRVAGHARRCHCVTVVHAIGGVRGVRIAPADTVVFHGTAHLRRDFNRIKQTLVAAGWNREGVWSCWAPSSGTPDEHRYDAGRDEAEVEMAQWRQVLDGARR